jgi:hypothetical protein
MKKERGSKREKQHGPYVRLPEWLLSCEAWQSLDGNSKALYVELARRYRGPNTNNGKIAYSIREAGAALHVGKNVANRCFVALLDRGFIKVSKNSGFNVKGRMAREWLLTEFPDDTMGVANAATKEFMRWEPPPHAGVRISSRVRSSHPAPARPRAVA